MISRPFLLQKEKMQLRLPNDPLQLLETPYQYLYIHRTIQSSRSASGKTQKQEAVGRVLIKPPIALDGKAVNTSDRISLDLKKSLTQEEEKEVLAMAAQKLPLMDRIWFLCNIVRIKRDLQCLAELLPQLSSLPPNCQGLDFYGEYSKTCDELRRLSDDCHENISDIPVEVGNQLSSLFQHPARLMLWAYHDANQKVPARLMKQIVSLVQNQEA